MNLKRVSSAYKLSSCQIYDASLGRIYHHSNNGFFVLSACRSTDELGNQVTSSENKERTYELFSRLKEANLGYIPVKGHYIENKDSNPTPVEEFSAFVPKPKFWSEERFYKFAEDLAKEFYQEAFIIKESPDETIKLIERDGDAYLLASEFNQISFNEAKMKDLFSSLLSKGKNWVFDGVPKPNSYMNAISLKNKGIIY